MLRTHQAPRKLCRRPQNRPKAKRLTRQRSAAKAPEQLPIPRQPRFPPTPQRVIPGSPGRTGRRTPGPQQPPQLYHRSPARVSVNPAYTSQQSRKSFVNALAGPAI